MQILTHLCFIAKDNHDTVSASTQRRQAKTLLTSIASNRDKQRIKTSKLFNTLCKLQQVSQPSEMPSSGPTFFQSVSSANLLNVSVSQDVAASPQGAALRKSLLSKSSKELLLNNCYALLNSRKLHLQHQKLQKISTRVSQVIKEQVPLKPVIDEKSRKIAAKSIDRESNRASTMTQS